MVYICVDLEASGPVPPLYSMLSLGAVAVQRTHRGHTPGASLYLEVKPAFPGVDAEALAIAGLDLDRLQREGLEAPEALDRLTAWAEAQREAPTDELVFVGHNAVFDWAYINYYYHHFERPNPFGYKALDTKALAMGVLRTDWPGTGKGNLSRLMPEIGLEDKSQKHRADYDAHFQARILCALLDRIDHPDGV